MCPASLVAIRLESPYVHQREMQEERQIVLHARRINTLLFTAVTGLSLFCTRLAVRRSQSTNYLRYESAKDPR